MHVFEILHSTAKNLRIVFAGCSKLKRADREKRQTDRQTDRQTIPLVMMARGASGWLGNSPRGCPEYMMSVCSSVILLSKCIAIQNCTQATNTWNFTIKVDLVYRIRVFIITLRMPMHAERDNFSRSGIFRCNFLFFDTSVVVCVAEGWLSCFRAHA